MFHIKAHLHLLCIYLLLAVLAVACPSCLCADGSPTGTSGVWRSEPSMPTPRMGPVLVFNKGKLLALGGTVIRNDRPMASNAIEEYDTSTGSWIQKKPIPDGLVIYSASVVEGRILAVMGTMDTDGNGFASAIFAYDTESQLFTHISDMPSPNADPIVCTSDTRLFIMAGAKPGDIRDAREVHIYDSASGMWSRAADIPTGRHAGQAIPIGGKLFVLGGVRNFKDNVKDVATLDTSSGKWEALKPMPEPRGYFAAAVYLDRILIAGGQGDIVAGRRQSHDSAWSYDPTSGEWAALAKLPIKWAHPRGIVIDGRLYILGGLLGNNVSGRMASLPLE